MTSPHQLRVGVLRDQVHRLAQACPHVEGDQALCQRCALMLAKRVYDFAFESAARHLESRAEAAQSGCSDESVSRMLKFSLEGAAKDLRASKVGSQ